MAPLRMKKKKGSGKGEKRGPDGGLCNPLKRTGNPIVLCLGCWEVGEEKAGYWVQRQNNPARAHAA